MTSLIAPPTRRTPSASLAAAPKWLLPAIFLVVLVIVFSLTSSWFLSGFNVYSIGQSFALSGLIAAGIALTMMVGEIDLSVAANASVAGIIALTLGDGQPVIGVVAAVAVGAVVGIFNGLVMVLFDLSSLVVTVATLVMLTGLAYLLASGNAVVTDDFATGEWLDQQLLTILSPRLLITIVVLIGLGLTLRFTRFGRDILATGSARKSAGAAGVRTQRTIVGVFTLSGVCAALGGSLLAFSLASVPPTVNGNLLLQAVTIAIVGGIALSGGTGSMTGVALGAAILVVLANGLASIGATTAAVSLVTGVVLFIFLMINRQPARPLQ